MLFGCYCLNVYFVIDYGSFFGGACNVTINKEDANTAKCEIKGFNGWSYNATFIFPLEEVDNLLYIYDEIGNWKDEYKDVRGILDGYGWTIELRIKDCIRKHGYEKFPNNYNAVMNKIKATIEELRDRYVEETEKKLVPLM